MNYIYQAIVKDDPDGGYLVAFPDVPEAITHGSNWDDAISSASEALGLALRGYLADGREIPDAKASDGVPIAVDAEDAIKIAVISAFREAGIPKTELARRLHKTENEARRILDPDHRSKLGQMQEALRALGKTLVISVQEAA